MSAVRWKVACINWGHADAPKALAYLLKDGMAHGERYCDTHAEALAHADNMARKMTLKDKT